jgi:spermidine/putrescine transport system ATP-binding protein
VIPAISTPAGGALCVHWRNEFPRRQGCFTAKGQAKVALDAGATISAGLGEGAKPSGKVTVVVRPEHASLVAASGKATLSGKLENIVYFGTDTHYHVRLNGGGEFIRHQNVNAGARALKR